MLLPLGRRSLGGSSAAMAASSRPFALRQVTALQRAHSSFGASRRQSPLSQEEGIQIGGGASEDKERHDAGVSYGRSRKTASRNDGDQARLSRSGGRSAFAGLREDAIRIKDSSIASPPPPAPSDHTAASNKTWQRPPTLMSQSPTAFARLRSESEQLRRPLEVSESAPPEDVQPKAPVTFARPRYDEAQPEPAPARPRQTQFSPLPTQFPTLRSDDKISMSRNVRQEPSRTQHQQQQQPRRADDWDSLRSTIQRGQEKEEAERQAQQLDLGLSEESLPIEQLFSSPSSRDFVSKDSRFHDLPAWTLYADAEEPRCELLVRRFAFETARAANQFATLFHCTEVLTGAEYPAFIGIFDQGGIYVVQVELGGSLEKPLTPATLRFARQCNGFHDIAHWRVRSEDNPLYKDAVGRETLSRISSSAEGNGATVGSGTRKPAGRKSRTSANMPNVQAMLRAKLSDIIGRKKSDPEIFKRKENKSSQDMWERVSAAFERPADQSGSPDEDKARIDDVVPVAVDGKQMGLHGKGGGGREMAAKKQGEGLDAVKDSDAALSVKDENDKINDRLGSVIDGTAPTSNSRSEDEARIDDIVPVAVDGEQVKKEGEREEHTESRPEEREQQRPEQPSNSAQEADPSTTVEDKVGSVLDGSSEQSGSRDEDKARIDDVVPVAVEGEQVPQKAEGAGAQEAARARETGERF